MTKESQLQADEKKSGTQRLRKDRGWRRGIGEVKKSKGQRKRRRDGEITSCSEGDVTIKGNRVIHRLGGSAFPLQQEGR